jgi:hypothetical protein
MVGEGGGDERMRWIVGAGLCGKQEVVGVGRGLAAVSALALAASFIGAYRAASSVVGEGERGSGRGH